MNSKLALRRASVLVLLVLAGVLPSQNLKATLVAHYTFENGSLSDQAASDGAQNLTTFGNAALTSPGIIGNGKLSLDGNGDYATSPSPDTDGFTNGAGVTLAAWFTTATVASNTQQVLIQLPIAGGTASQSGAGLEISSGKLQVGGRSVGGVGGDTYQFNDATLASNTLTLSSNTTYFAAAVLDYANDTVTAYLYDGATWKIQPVNVAFANPTGSGNQGLNLGRRADGVRYFNGSIDEVKIFNTTLSEADVKALSVPEPSSVLLLVLAIGAAFVRQQPSNC